MPTSTRLLVKIQLSFNCRSIGPANQFPAVKPLLIPSIFHFYLRGPAAAAAAAHLLFTPNGLPIAIIS